MDWAAGLTQAEADASGPSRDQLGDDRDRGLGRRRGTDVESARRVDPMDFLIREPDRPQAFDPVSVGTAAAERADVPRARTDGRAKGRLVELRVMGEDENRVTGPETYC